MLNLSFKFLYFLLFLSLLLKNYLLILVEGIPDTELLAFDFSTDSHYFLMEHFVYVIKFIVLMVGKSSDMKVGRVRGN